MAIDLVTIHHHNGNDHHHHHQQHQPRQNLVHARGNHHEQLNSFLKFVNFSPFQEDHTNAQFNLNLLELIKSTKLNSNIRNNNHEKPFSSSQTPSSTNKRVNKSRRFSLPDLRRFLLRSRTPQTPPKDQDLQHNQDGNDDNDDSKTRGIKNKQRKQCLQRLHSIQEYSEESNSNNTIVNIPEPNDGDDRIATKDNPIEDDDDVSKSSSTETLKVDDQISSSKPLQPDSKVCCDQQAYTSTPTSIIPSPAHSLSIESRPSSPLPDGNNEEILETLRQVLRRCTKMDMSKRASALEVHQMLNTKLLNKYNLDVDKSRSNDHQHNDDDDNCGHRKPQIQIEDSKD